MKNDKSFWGNIGDYFRNLWNINETAAIAKSASLDVSSQCMVSIVLMNWLRELTERVERIESVQEAEVKFNEAMDELVGKQIELQELTPEKKPAKSKRGRPKGKKNKTTKNK